MFMRTPTSIEYQRFQSVQWLIVCLFACLIVGMSQGQASAQLPDVKRILFLGDSITHAGGYVSSLEAAILVQHPDRHLELINAGLPSETVSGLSEPGHAGGQFPRPDLHERLQRVLEQVKPELVVACYGMNDGIYYPLGDERFAKFKSGIERLHQAVEQRGAKIIHLTPAYFDALPNKDKLLPAGLDEYRTPYVGYDDVLEHYSNWLLSKRTDGWEVVDVHAAMKSAVQKRRETQPDFSFAKDGVHPNAAGQAVMTGPLAAVWGLKLDDQGRPVHPQAEEIIKLVSQKQQLIKYAWLTATKHVRPGIPTGLPLAEAQAKANELDEKIRAIIASK